MKMVYAREKRLRDRLLNAWDRGTRYLFGPKASVALGDLVGGTTLGGHLQELVGRSVLIATHDQLATACALIEIDGVARRLTISPFEVSFHDLANVIKNACIDAIVTDRDDVKHHFRDTALQITCNSEITPAKPLTTDPYVTEWVLLTSGTTGMPKMLVHTLAGLSSAIQDGGPSDIVWGTFYDIRRYGGLQIYLRAVLGRGSFVVSSVTEPIKDYLLRLSAHGATHISGTPSHWRRALMSPEARSIAPRYIRLSGEIADQAILDSLRSFCPNAQIGHAFASTEAGVAFEVNDAFEGFPSSLLTSQGKVELKIIDGTLRIRSPSSALTYLGETDAVLRDADGFIDTGDILELRGQRYYFLGRRTGVINVGGLKVHPEEVEAVINRHPAVKMSFVHSRKSPITGAIVAADVLLASAYRLNESASTNDIKREIFEMCHNKLAKHKVPATIRFVVDVDIAASGKIARRHA